MPSILNEYVFLGIVRTPKIKEIFRLMDKNIDQISFIVPKCQEQDITIIHKEYCSHINKIYFIDGIQKEQIDRAIDILDNYIDQIKSIFSIIKQYIHDIRGVIPSCEAAVYPAATIRTLFKISGLQAQEAILFRDKSKMKQKIELEGVNHNIPIRLPKYASLKDLSIQNIMLQMKALNISFPIILKPKAYGGSFGVYLVQNLNDLQEISFAQVDTPYEINEYIPHKVAHSNGIVDEGTVNLVSNYYYNDTPLKCGCEGMYSIAHIEISDPELNKKINSFTTEIMHRLGMKQGVFHLELFIDQQCNLTFLEVAARTPGAITVPVIEITTGINLQTVSCLMDMNRSDWKSYVQSNQVRSKPKYYGEYIIPVQRANPIEVVDIDLTNIEGVNIEKTILPQVGDQIFPNRILYANLGILLFSGSSTEHLLHQYDILESHCHIKVKEI